MDEDVKELIEFEPPEWHLDDLVEAAESGVSWLFLVTLEDGAPQLTRFSPGVQRFFNKKPDDFWHFDTWREFLGDEEHERIRRFFLSLPDSNRVFELECRLKPSKSFSAIMRVAARRAGNLIFGSFKDITTEKLAEEGLQRQYQLMMSIFTTAPIPIFLCDEKFHIIETNQNGAHFLEKESPAQVFGFRLLDRIRNEDREKLQSILTSPGTATEVFKVEIKNDGPRAENRTLASFQVTVIPYENTSRALIIVNDRVELSSPSESSAGRIVFVGPNLNTRLQFEKLLAKIDLQPQLFLSGEKLLENYQPENGTIVVIDDDLPGLSAAELAKTLRRVHEEKKTGVKLFLLKTRDDPKPVDTNLFEGTLEKPLTLTSLRRRFLPLKSKKKGQT